MTEPTTPSAKTSPLVMGAAFAVAALAGAVATYIAIDLTAEPAPHQALSGSAAQSVAPPDPAAVAAAESETVRLYEQINRGFVEQLRKYGTRLQDIADVAEAEGSETAATQMRELAAETDALIERHDKIAKQ